MIRALPLLFLASGAWAQWSWDNCVGGPGYKTEKCGGTTCARREVNSTAAQWGELTEELRHQLGDAMGKAGAYAEQAKADQKTILDQLKRFPRAGRVGAIANCLSEAETQSSLLIDDFKRISKDTKTAVPYCNLPLGDPETIKEAGQCEPYAEDSYKRYQAARKRMKAVAEKLGDVAACTSGLDPEEDADEIAAYSALASALKSKQEESVEKMIESWCSFDGSPCRTSPEKIRTSAERIKNLAAVIEPFPKDLRPPDNNRIKMLVEPIKTADARTEPVLPLVRSPTTYSAETFNFLEAIVAMMAVNESMGIAYVKWKTWTCYTCCIPLKVCYAKKGSPEEKMDRTSNQCGKPGAPPQP